MELAKIQKGLEWPFPDTDAVHASLHLSIQLGRLQDALHETTHDLPLNEKQAAYSLATIIVACARIANLTGINLDDHIEAAIERHKPRD